MTVPPGFQPITGLEYTNYQKKWLNIGIVANEFLKQLVKHTTYILKKNNIYLPFTYELIKRVEDIK